MRGETMRKHLYGFLGFVLTSVLSTGLVLCLRQVTRSTAEVTAQRGANTSPADRGEGLGRASSPEGSASHEPVHDACKWDPTPPADVNFDGRCDKADIRTMRQAMKAAPTEYRSNYWADFDRDRKIDEADFGIFMQLYTYEREYGAKAREEILRRQGSEAPPN